MSAIALLDNQNLSSSDTSQRRTAYNANLLPEYIGYAIRGEATSSGTWIIWKFTYDANNMETLKQTAFDSWDNKATASYA